MKYFIIKIDKSQVESEKVEAERACHFLGGDLGMKEEKGGK